MGEEIALAEFKKGITLLRSGHSLEAYEHLRQAAELKEQNPYYVSFFGVSVARAQRKWSAAMKLCESALTMKRNEPQLYLNLTEVYVAGGHIEDAVEALDSGLRFCGPDERLLRARSNLGRRRPPVLPFLPRGNFLNLSLGKLRYIVQERRRKSQCEPCQSARFTASSERLEVR